MDSGTTRLGSTWLVLAVTLRLGAQPSPDAPRPHDAPFRPPDVTAIAFSADGKQLAASYFVQALNRPGTDWGAWVTGWDLASGERVTFAKAMEPVLPLGPGKWAVARYERSLERRWLKRMAVWRWGNDGRVLARPKEGEAGREDAVADLPLPR